MSLHYGADTFVGGRFSATIRGLPTAQSSLESVSRVNVVAPNWLAATLKRMCKHQLRNIALSDLPWIGRMKLTFPRRTWSSLPSPVVVKLRRRRTNRLCIPHSPGISLADYPRGFQHSHLGRYGRLVGISSRLGFVLGEEQRSSCLATPRPLRRTCPYAGVSICFCQVVPVQEPVIDS
jgi:hypothetical protein